MSTAITKEWPFHTVEFGNPDQIKFLQIQRDIQRKIDVYDSKDTDCVDIEEETQYRAKCPECNYESDLCNSEMEAFEQIADMILVRGRGKLYMCKGCEQPLIKLQCH